MTVEQYLDKYNNYIRRLIYNRAVSDYRDDAYQEVVMQIIKHKDKLDSLDTDSARCAYICKIAKSAALPQRKADKKLKTYGDFTASDDSDATDPEEWFLEDERLRPDNQPDLAKRAWAEQIIDTNELLKNITKTLSKIKRGTYLNREKISLFIHKDKYVKHSKEYRKRNLEKCREWERNYKRKIRADPERYAKDAEWQRKYYEKNREKIKEYQSIYRQKRKEQRNEQFRHA